MNPLKKSLIYLALFIAAALGGLVVLAGEARAVEAEAKELVQTTNMRLDFNKTASGPPKEVTFQTDRPYMISSLYTYHWNGGKGSKPVTVALQGEDGQTYGPFNTRPFTFRDKENLIWAALNGHEGFPLLVLPAGKYTVVDSDPATWTFDPNKKAASFGQGMVEIWGVWSPEIEQLAAVQAGKPAPPEPASPEPTTPEPADQGEMLALFSDQGAEGQLMKEYILARLEIVVILEKIKANADPEEIDAWLMRNLERWELLEKMAAEVLRQTSPPVSSLGWWEQFSRLFGPRAAWADDYENTPLVQMAQTKTAPENKKRAVNRPLPGLDPEKKMGLSNSKPVIPWLSMTEKERAKYIKDFRLTPAEVETLNNQYQAKRETLAELAKRIREEKNFLDATGMTKAAFASLDKSQRQEAYRNNWNKNMRQGYGEAMKAFADSLEIQYREAQVVGGPVKAAGGVAMAGLGAVGGGGPTTYAAGLAMIVSGTAEYTAGQAALDGAKKPGLQQELDRNAEYVDTAERLVSLMSIGNSVFNIRNIEAVGPFLKECGNILKDFLIDWAEHPDDTLVDYVMRKMDEAMAAAKEPLAAAQKELVKALEEAGKNLNAAEKELERLAETALEAAGQKIINEAQAVADKLDAAQKELNDKLDELGKELEVMVDAAGEEAAKALAEAGQKIINETQAMLDKVEAAQKKLAAKVEAMGKEPEETDPVSVMLEPGEKTYVIKNAGETTKHTLRATATPEGDYDFGWDFGDGQTTTVKGGNTSQVTHEYQGEGDWQPTVAVYKNGQEIANDTASVQVTLAEAENFTGTYRGVASYAQSSSVGSGQGNVGVTLELSVSDENLKIYTARVVYPDPTHGFDVTFTGQLNNRHFQSSKFRANLSRMTIETAAMSFDLSDTGGSLIGKAYNTYFINLPDTAYHGVKVTVNYTFNLTKL